MLGPLALLGCANQKDVTPLLRVEPNAAARFSYFEKRAAAMIREQRGPAAETAEEAEAAEEEECATNPAAAPRTWGVPEPQDEEGQGTSCDRAQND